MALPSYQDYLAQHQKTKDTLVQNAKGMGYFLDPSTGTFKQDPTFRTGVEQVKDVEDVAQAPLQTRQLQAQVTKSEADVAALPAQAKEASAKAVTAEAAAKQAVRNENLASNIINEVEGISTKVNTSDSRIQQVKRYLGAVKQDDVEAAELLTMKAFIGPLIRQFGEKGALSDGDVARAINAIPNVSDTRKVATAKLARLRRLVDKGQGNLDKGTATTGNPTPQPNVAPTPNKVGRFTVEVE